MPPYIDLHLHSSCSDGRYSPEEVVSLAMKAGLSAIALADHDNLDGIDRMMMATGENGIECISGVELSVVWCELNDVHLLSYGFDHRNAALVRELELARDFRENRNEKIVERVNQCLTQEGKSPISFERIRQSADGTVGRPHIGVALVKAGHVKDMEEAFQRYLVPCNVEKRLFPIRDAIELIRQAGGVSVLAHPPYITRDRAKFSKMLDNLVDFGLDGIEAYNSGAGPTETGWYLTEARRRGLLVTGGSDFHGHEDDTSKIGFAACQQRIPYSCLTELKETLAG